MSLTRYTGHPFIDIGVATITAFYNVNTPDEILDVTEFIDYVCDKYINPVMSGYLGAVAFANVGYANPSMLGRRDLDETRRSRLRALLELYKPEATITDNISKIVAPAEDGDRCIFSGDPALVRVSREVIPMTLARNAINFLPQGRPLLPISGWAVLALLAMPLGSLNSGGRLLLVDSNDPKIKLHFAQEHLQMNQAAMQMDHIEKLPNYSFAKTYLLSRLTNIQFRIPHGTSVTAYHFTSSSQNARIDIYPLPSNALNFVTSAKRLYPDAWSRISQNAKERHSPKDEVILKKSSGKQQLTIQRRNFFYEDIFRLPQTSKQFLRRYFLRQPIYGLKSKEKKLDPRSEYSFLKEPKCIHWGLTSLFLERMMNMDLERIEDIKNLADRLADYIGQSHQQNKLFKGLFLSRSAYDFRAHLLRMANSAKTENNDSEPLLPYDQFVNMMFSIEGDFAKQDWGIGRDLLLVRMIEQLHRNDNWMENNLDELKEIEEALAKEAEQNTKT